MVLVPKPAGEVTVGDPEAQGKQRKERIDWSYAIGAKEVTVDQFLGFRKDHQSFFRAAWSGRSSIVVRCGGILQLAEQGGRA